MAAPLKSLWIFLQMLGILYLFVGFEVVGQKKVLARINCTELTSARTLGILITWPWQNPGEFVYEQSACNRE